MPRTPQANQQIREDTSEKILQAASRVFARKGMAAKMDEVAAEAGVSKGLAYHYFQSKEAIFIALVKHMIPPLDELRAKLEKMPGPPRDRLTRIVSTMVERRRKEPEFYLLLNQAVANNGLPPDVIEGLNSQGLLMHDIIRRLIIEGQARGEFVKDNPNKLTRAILACLDGLSRMAPLPPEKTEDETPDASIILRMLSPKKGQE
jgi:AcrR family transcriptional regulator